MLLLPLLLLLTPAGGWVPQSTGIPSLSIPSKDMMFINNLIVNPNNASAMWAHFAVSSCSACLCAAQLD
jgi:hypothetical protein